MFDLTTEPAKRPLREPSAGSRVAAILAHAAALIAVIAVPVSRVVNVETETPTIQAFVVTPEALPPLPAAPPPAPIPPTKSERVSIEQPAAPSEPPVDIQPEHTNSPQLDTGAVPEGGLAGGVPGGVVGGIAGGVGAVAPIPPALPPPPTHPAAPLRVSGPIKTPDLLHRVEPVYSAIAAVSRVSGVVILEAVVDMDGSIQSVKVLRGRSPLLDNAAIEALKQWKYAPLVIAGVPTPFALTVTFNFSIPPA